MCVKLPSRTWTPILIPHTSQTFILIKWSLHQRCAVIIVTKYWFFVFCFLVFFFNIVPEYSGYLLSTTLHMPNGELSLLFNKCMIRKQTKPGLLTWIRQLLALKQGTETYDFLTSLGSNHISYLVGKGLLEYTMK